MNCIQHTLRYLNVRSAVFAAALAVLTASSSACNIPVFRYALERWQADTSDVVVFRHGPLSEEDAAAIAKLKSYSRNEGGSANFSLVQHHVGVDGNQERDELWKALKPEGQSPAPYVVVRSRVSKGKVVNTWHGKLTDFRPERMFHSAVRKELSRRLLAGDSTVWLVLKSSDEQRNKQVDSLLRTKLKQLGNDMPLPEGIGLPGSELLSEVPLLMKFSILEIDPTDKNEAHLINMFRRLAPEATKANQPIVVPVFGRGRALEVIPADQLNESLVEDLTVFLSGACSCQVKEMNPGFDLLMTTDWKTELYGEDGIEPVDSKSVDSESDGLPVLVPIPSGRSAASAKSDK